MQAYLWVYTVDRINTEDEKGLHINAILCSQTCNNCTSFKQDLPINNINPLGTHIGCDNVDSCLLSLMSRMTIFVSDVKAKWRTILIYTHSGLCCCQNHNHTHLYQYFQWTVIHYGDWVVDYWLKKIYLLLHLLKQSKI